MRKFHLAAVGVMAAAALLGTARAEAAGNYTLNYSVAGSDSLYSTVRRSNGQSLNVKAGTVTAKWRVANSKPQGYADQFHVYCVDMDNVSVSPSSVTLEKVAPGEVGGTNRLMRAAWLFNQFGGSVEGSSGSDRQKRGAALQLAIWNVMEDDDLDVTTQGAGRFYLKSASGYTDEVSTLANSWLTAMGNDNVGTGTWFKIDRSRSKGQDMIGASLVPEPGSMVLLFSGGVACLGGLRRRKQRKNELVDAANE